MTQAADLSPLPARLRFPPRIEKDFQQDYAQASLLGIRVSMILGLILYSAFAFLDYLATPLHREQAWLIRFVIADPAFLLTLLASRTAWFVRVSQWWTSAMVLVAGGGILAIIALVGSDEIGFWLYYAGLMLVIYWAYTLARLRFWHATVSVLIVVLGYEFVAINVQKLLTYPQGVTFFINNNFFFLSATIIGMVTGYLLEFYARRDYLQRYALAQQNADLEAYARTVAHDLKNPLGAIAGFAEIIEEDYASQLPGDAPDLVKSIRSTSRNMARIIDELLMLSRVRRLEDIQLSRVEMGQVVSAALDRLAANIAESGAQIVQPQEWPAAIGHSAWLEEVWANYVSNAIKYGGEPPVVELGAKVEGGWARFWVRDNGKGMTSDDQARLFSEFTRLENVDLKEGHGLGLSIVQRILEKLGGRVGVESELGRGSAFYFTLPVAAPDAFEGA